MQIIHRLKTTEHVVPLCKKESLCPTAFATYSDKDSDGRVTHIAVGWELTSLHEGQYSGHKFELRFSPEIIDEVIQYLTDLSERFSEPKLPF